MEHTPLGAGNERVLDAMGAELMRLQQKHAMTLLELLIVVAVLVALAGLVIPMFSDIATRAADVTTRATLTAIARAITGVPEAPGFRQDLGKLPTAIGDLLVIGSHPTFEPASARGWRGPYLLHHGAVYAIDASKGFTTAYGSAGSPTLRDAWGNPIVLQFPAKAGTDFTAEEKSTYVRLISAGPDGVLDTPADVLMPASAARDDDLLLFIATADLP
jgi:prepilin-type N-terminal cleavage/methylation domain-containing protein